MHFMKKNAKTPTKTIGDNKSKGNTVKSSRKNTSGDTRNADRQRSGNNDPQNGSH
jgi:hypothetical protein